MSFYTRPGRLKPGSLYPDGSIVDHAGKRHEKGPCFITLVNLSWQRKQAMNNFGWRFIHAPDWPGIPPSQKHYAIQRFTEEELRQWHKR